MPIRDHLEHLSLSRRQLRETPDLDLSPSTPEGTHVHIAPQRFADDIQQMFLIKGQRKYIGGAETHGRHGCFDAIFVSQKDYRNPVAK